MLSNDRQFTAILRDSKRERVIAKGTIHGTVASGFPCTTLNNSLRSLGYMLTIVRLANIPYDLATNTGDVVLYLAGDD